MDENNQIEYTAANWNIGFGIFYIVIGIILTIFIIGIPFIIFGYKTMYWNKQYKLEQSELNIWKAGIYGTFWGPVITGTMILRSSEEIRDKEKEELIKFSWVTFWIWIIGIITFWFMFVSLVALIMILVLAFKTYGYKSIMLYKYIEGDFDHKDLEEQDDETKKGEIANGK